MAEEHAEVDRLSSLVAGLAQKVGLCEKDRKALAIAASMTAVKRIPMKDITSKRGPLTQDDRTRMREHAAVWADFAGQLEPLRELGVARILETYTEHWDGTGHPAGLSGEDIPAAARILSICYHYNGMTSDRAYRKALPHEHAAGELTRMSGTLLAPGLVEAFLEMTADEGEAGGDEARSEGVGGDVPTEDATADGAREGEGNARDSGKTAAKKSAPGSGAAKKSEKKSEKKNKEKNKEKSKEKKGGQKRGARKDAARRGAGKRAAHRKKRG